MQVHLLRVLQEHAYEPLGASRSETTDARVILATNEDLAEMVRKGAFRKDLYYRVNVARLELPPLRRRKEDIPLLVEQMIESFNRSQGECIQGIEPEVLSLLMAYDWPGNVRELQNAIERSFNACDDRLIGIKHLPKEITIHGLSADIAFDLESEVQAVRAALERNGFDRSATARDLGIDRSCLFRKMKTLGILAPKKDGRSRHRRQESSR
jgi:transcriptional regulator with PAS, ATPase and Fis domain